MTGSAGSRPPAVWSHLLRRLVPRNDRDHVARELEALYRLRRERWGRTRADRWYRTEVLGFIPRAWSFRPRIPRRPSHRGEALVGEWRRDVYRAGRGLLRSPGWTAVATLTLTMGIGANTLIFSVVDHVAFRALPYDEPDALVQVWPGMGMLRGEVDIMQRESRTLTRVAGYATVDGFNLGTDEGGRRVQGFLASPALLDVLGVRPVLGRNFVAAEAEPGGEPAVLLSYRLWREAYGGDPDIVGRRALIDDSARTVVGILPSDFAFPAGGQDVIVPLVMDPANVGLFWGWGGHRVVARLAPGASVEVVRDELRGLSQEMRTANPLWTPPPDFRANADVVSLHRATVGDVQPMLLVLLGAVALVLLVASANVANLLLVRGLGRRREIALRGALGASRYRIAREQLIESVLLAGGGCAVALVAAYTTLDAVVALLPPEIPRADEIALDGRVLAVGVAFALAAGVIAGLLPAVRGSRTDPGLVLRESGRGGDGSPRRNRISAAIVSMQVAVAVVLVVDAGLLFRSLQELGRVDVGFRPEGITTARLTLSAGLYDDPAARHRLYEEVRERVAAAPGVQSAAVGTRVPFGRRHTGVATFMEGVTADPNNLPVLNHVAASPEYMETLGLSVVQGRGIASSDGPDAPLVALVDQTAADAFWPGESPIGRRIRYPWRGAPWIEIVGVVGGVADDDLAAERVATYYVPLAQLPPGQVTVLARSAGAGDRVAAAIRAAVSEIDDRIPVSRVVAMDGLVAESMARSRWLAGLLGVFAVITLGLGCVGVFGVVAYSVRARTHEIGVRMALGADRGRIRAVVLGDGLRLAAPGVVVGMLLAVPAARALESLLFGVSALDPATFVAVPFALLVAALVAAYLPARRAIVIDPMASLRSDG